MYEIGFDDASRRLELRLWGFWTDETMTRFSDRLRQAVSAAQSKHKAFDILSDASEFPIQAAAIVPRFGELMQSIDIARYGKVAVIVGTMLGKVQADRAQGGSTAGTFRDRAAAIAWLSAGD